jgi:osmotically-inducible protein OsmY
MIKKSTTPMVMGAMLLSVLLSACAPVMFGGVIGTAMVASDRRTSGAQVDDEAIEIRGASAMRENFGTNAHINITGYNRQVLLTGEVPNDQQRLQAEQLVSKLPNVRSIVNELAVGPASSLADRSSDALITARVKAAMVDSEDVFANVYKVVTERGTVYLMGRVTQREAQRATEVARSVGGVKRVVRVFEFLTEDELRALQPKKSGVDLNQPSTPVAAPVSSGTPLNTGAPAANSGVVVGQPIK